MLKAFIFPLLGTASLSASAAFADATQCADATADLKYSAWTYEGGPAPGPGMTVGMTDWSFKGTLLEEIRQIYDEPTPAAKIVSRFDPATKVILDSTTESGGAIGNETYGIKVTLSRADGGPVLPNASARSVTVRMLCERSWNYTIP